MTPLTKCPHGVMPYREVESENPAHPAGSVSLDCTPCTQATEFSRRRSLPHVTVEHLSTKRTQDTYLRRGGQFLGSQHKLFTRGKVTSTSFVLPPIEDL